ncbi:MAG TPA: hypothetical protein VNN13_09110 [Methylomirabilota bacterium]|nr:hypothetical protein [Methylomirabilota bacterium]
MTLQATDGDYFRWLVSCLVSFALWSGCSLQPLQQQSFTDSEQIVDRKADSLNADAVVGAPQRVSEVTFLALGKIEIVPAQQKVGVVIGAPHGTFDFYTERAAREICFRTGVAGVIATGFTPTETGDGWRINVNRPSERHASLTLREKETARASVVYKHFKDSVLRAAQGSLALYIDIHQNGGSRIEVASVGISRTEASFIKRTYHTLRDQALAERPGMVPVELAIEPLDEIEVGAWAAKTNGILSVAKRSLHFELPSDGVMASSHQRAIYTSILSELIRRIADRVTSGATSRE